MDLVQGGGCFIITYKGLQLILQCMLINVHHIRIVLLTFLTLVKYRCVKLTLHWPACILSA